MMGQPEDADEGYDPYWSTCDFGRGHRPCLGAAVEPFSQCLEHLSPDDLDELLHSMEPGADLDARGTRLGADLLDRLVRAVQVGNEAPTFGRCVFYRSRFAGEARFTGVRFTRYVEFSRAHFHGEALFDEARFDAQASFSGTTFHAEATFEQARFASKLACDEASFQRVKFHAARFADSVGFEGATFHENVWFDRSEFRGYTDFRGARFAAMASFGGYFVANGARFIKAVYFSKAEFAGRLDLVGTRFDAARFDETRFALPQQLGPFTANEVELDAAVFAGPVRLTAVASRLSCVGTRFDAGATMRLRFAIVDLEDAVFAAPSLIGGSDVRFHVMNMYLDEDSVELAVPDERRRATELMSERAARNPAAPPVPLLTSLRGVDAADLVLADVDLTWCAFSGAHHLDKLRLEGRCSFGLPPAGWRFVRAWPKVWRWTRRQAIAEERAWRADRPRGEGWRIDSRPHPDPEMGPERLATVYRALRKSLEDTKNEPGAADFYYGEMEMRRHSSTTAPLERSVLSAYWLLSGYGLRASRALLALAGVLVLTAVLLVGWGLPADPPSPRLTGTVGTASAGQPAQLDAQLTPDDTNALPPGGDRWTGERFDKALRVALGSIAFRDPEQRLTSAGSWTLVVARVLGPLLLALAVLAVRARVRR